MPKVFVTREIDEAGITILELDNVVLTPHLGSATAEARQKVSRVAATNIIAVLDGRDPPNPVKEP